MATHETHVTSGSTVDFGKFLPVGLVLAVIGWALFFIVGPGMAGDGLTPPEGGHAINPLYGSYMFGLLFWTAVTLGCLGLSLLHHATRGSWSTSVIRLFEAGGGVGSLLMMAVLFIPVFFIPHAMENLYEWTHMDVVNADPILSHKKDYLNPTRFFICFGIYFVIWMYFAGKMRASTLKQDETKNFTLEKKRESWGAAGIVAFMLTATFATVDWIMSMEPHWYSTMYGAWLVVNSAYGALALATVFLCANAHKQPYARIVAPGLTKDIGNMLFVLTMLWGYTTLSQFLIIWNGGMPETTQYFARRMALFPHGTDGNYWAILGFIIIIGTFFIPFYTLLAPRTKRFPQNLKKIATWMFFMALLNMYLIVIPALPGRAPLGPLTGLTLPDLFAWLGVGGLWLLVFGAMAKRAPLVPLYDNRLEEAAKHAH